jgi:hypothetical protein
MAGHQSRRDAKVLNNKKGAETGAFLFECCCDLAPSRPPRHLVAIA